MSKSLVSKTVSDHAAIAGVVQLYIDGFAAGDVSKLEEAFHEDARMFGRIGDQRLDMPIRELFELVAKMPPMDSEGTYDARITSVEQVDDVATARLDEQGCWGSASFVDFFTLTEIDGRWKIVNKAFVHTGGEIPAL